MWEEDKQPFKELSDKLGSNFAAVNYIAKQARSKQISIGNTILDSQAISWILTGKSPEIHRVINDDNRFILSPASLSSIDEVMCYIDDEEVEKSIRDTLRCSKMSGHLIYVYTQELKECDKPRVRIISNVLWDKMCDD